MCYNSIINLFLIKKNKKNMEIGTKKINLGANPLYKNKESEENLDINLLMSQAEKLKNKERMLNAKEMMGKNRIKDIRTKFIQKLFEIMMDAGVDPSNTESINSFLQELENTDPDLREIFEMAFNDLLSEDDDQQEQVTEDNQQEQTINTLPSM